MFPPFLMRGFEPLLLVMPYRSSNSAVADDNGTGWLDQSRSCVDRRREGRGSKRNKEKLGKRG
jgi:hypothetical protein